MNTRKLHQSRRRRAAARLLIEAFGFAGLCGLVALSAVITKQATHHRPLPPMASIDSPQAAAAPAQPTGVLGLDITDPLADADVRIEEAAPDFPLETRWFNGRPVRPAKTLWMTVTAYSPDERSCGDSADGITASLHSVWTNGMKLAAADTRLLPLGSMITVPGYDNEQIVPVLDRGGAIKGHRLDMLYPTHEIAQKWGVQRLKVTVWEYADGKPKTDWRKVRDSK